MYKTFRVKNFRCFKDLQINDLGRVNLIAGPNNTGKTALMEAMYLHTRPFSPEELSYLQQARGIDFGDDSRMRSWEMIEAAHEAFKNDDAYEFRFHRLERNLQTGDIEAVTYNGFGMDAVTSVSYEVRG